MTAGTPPALLERLRDPAFYGLPPHTAIAHRQTHISHVFLAGDRAFKIKKPVDFGFLDFTSVAARERACRDEVRLNRRLTHDVYLRAQPIARAPDGAYTFGGAGPAAEWCVVMRRLSDSDHLAARIAAGADAEGYVPTIADRLVHFSRTAEADAGGREYGRVATLTANWDENLQQTTGMVGDLLTPLEFSTVAAATSRFLGVHGPMLDARADAGFVGDLHGDLRCEHVYLEDGRVQILDCIEFNRRFRCCDAANDLAFLGMDLDRLGAPGAARALLVAYATRRPDPGAYAIWDFFKCYRAYVRGKVAAFTARDAAVPEAQRADARQTARTAFHWAHTYAQRFVRPPCICLCGPMGSGKSTVAAALARHADLAVIATDAVRKELAGLAATARVGDAQDRGLYSAAMSRRTYLAVIDRAREHLERGRGVVLDGTFSRREGRSAAREMARDVGADFLLVDCRLDERENLRRLERRLADAARISDARPDLLARHLAGFECVQADEAQRIVRCDLARPVAEVEHAVLQGVYLG